jgi:Domain of unknown function (DUF4118)
LIRYAIAVFLVLLAWAVTFTLRTSVQASTFQTPFFVCAIVLSGWMGGFGPGILATVLSIFALEYWLTLEACMPDNRQSRWVLPRIGALRRDETGGSPGGARSLRAKVRQGGHPD